MANPPFNLDVTDPADNAVVSQFPANERAFRDAVNSYLNTEHDLGTGYHKFQILTTTDKNALASPPTGMLVYDLTLLQLQMNTGTPGAPVWTPMGADATGVIKAFAGSTAPAGYLICDGSAVSRTTYANLFAIVGTTYGAGDGSTTFNLPDLRGRTIIGVGQGSGLTNRALAATGGEETHTLSANEMPTHSHGVNDPGHQHYISPNQHSFGGLFDLSGPSQACYQTSLSGETGAATNIQTVAAAGTGISIQNAGGGAAHNNMQPFIALNYVIKT